MNNGEEFKGLRVNEDRQVFYRIKPFLLKLFGSLKHQQIISLTHTISRRSKYSLSKKKYGCDYFMVDHKNYLFVYYGIKDHDQKYILSYLDNEFPPELWEKSVRIIDGHLTVKISLTVENRR